MKTIFITKYCLTKGIIKLIPDSIEDGMAKVVRGHLRSYYHKPYWHDNEADAIAHSLKVIERKFKSIQKTQEKLNRMRESLIARLSETSTGEST